MIKKLETKIEELIEELKYIKELEKNQKKINEKVIKEDEIIIGNMRYTPYGYSIIRTEIEDKEKECSNETIRK